MPKPVDVSLDAWMPLYIGDYKRDTGRLTTEQHGAYLLLIMEYWTTGPLSDDDDELSAIVKMSPREWKKIRQKIARFFRIVDGYWRHKRVDEELESWAEKKRRFIERAAAGGRAKAAKSTKNAASSTSKALLNVCTSASSTVEGTPYVVPSLSGQNDFLGPQEIRQAFVAKMGEDWCRSYIDPSGWQDVPERALIPTSQFAASKISREGRAVVASVGIAVIERRAMA